MADRGAILDALAVFVGKQTPEGEHFHPHYREAPEAFDELVRAEAALARGMRAAWRRQAEALDTLVDWTAVESERARQASGTVHRSHDDPVPEDRWADEDTQTGSDLEPGMERSTHAGVDAANHRSGGWGGDRTISAKTEASRWARVRSLEQAKTVNATTRARLREVIARGLDANWGSRRMADEMSGLVGDRARAEMIARTESIRAYTEGSMSFARSVGATKKRWLNGQPDACVVCEGLDNQVVGIDEEFDAGVDAPPAHPHCRCSISHEFPGSDPDDARSWF